jgi:hypothetical protein
MMPCMSVDPEKLLPTRTAPPQSRLRRAFRLVSLLAVWGIASILLLEGACRLTGLGGGILYRRGLYEVSEDAELGYVLTPGHRGTSYGTRVEINEMGFRHPSISRERPPGVYRVVGVGDSFTFGMGVRQEESWPAQLEALLKAPPGYERVEVVNVGVPGYNLRQYCRKTKLKVLDLEPNLVVMGLVENDLEPAFYVEDGYLCVPRKKTTISFPGKRWLQTNSHFYQALNMRYQGWASAYLQRKHAEDARSILFGDQDPGAWDEAVERLQKCYRKVLSECSDFLVVSFALSDQSPLPQIVERARVPAAHLNLDGCGLRLPDGHPNARGHGHLAEQIAGHVANLIAGAQGKGGRWEQPFTAEGRRGTHP